MREGVNVYTLLYNQETNMFEDEFGVIVLNIYDYITPNELLVFRAGFVNMMLPYKNKEGFYVQLLHPEIIKF